MLPFLIPLAVLFGSIALTLAVALRTKRKIDSPDRRSPLSGKLHHVPGQQLLDRLSALSDDIIESLIIMMYGPAFLGLLWLITKVRWESVRLDVTLVPFVLAGIGLFIWEYRKLRKFLEERRRARDGLAAERMTGQQLNRLIGPECMVLHDVPADGFNIDHVVIASRAIYAVETKSFRKPKKAKEDGAFKVSYDGKRLIFPDWSTDEPLAQSRRQADWLRKWLRDALGNELPVIPAVALPGWWIDLGKDASTSDVRVFTPMGKGAQFMVSPSVSLSAPQRALVAQALALRYPDAAE